MDFNFSYSGLNVAMPLPVCRDGVVWCSWITALRRREIYCINYFWQSLPGSLPRRKREVQKVQDTIMLFLLWKYNDGKLSNVCHVNISIWGCLKEEDTFTNIFPLFLKAKWTFKSGILIKSQKLPVKAALKIWKVFIDSRENLPSGESHLYLK